MKPLQVCAFIVVASLFALCTVGCRTREQETMLRENEQNKIMDSQSILLYKTSYSTGSACGGCDNTTTDYWYGTNIEKTDFLKSYKTLLNDQSWHENDNTFNTWYKDDGDIHFRGYFEIYDDLMDEAVRCNRLGFMMNGRILTEGTPLRLTSQFKGHVLELIATPKAQAQRLALTDPAVRDALAFGDRLHLHPTTLDEPLVRLPAMLATAGVSVTMLRPIAPGLEDLFISLLEPATKGIEN